VINTSSKLGLLLAFIFISNTAFCEQPKTLTYKTGIQYMTGGVGEDQVEDMGPFAKNFSLNLLFSEGTSGRAITNLNVNIYDTDSKLVFRIVGAGPRLYVNLAAGTYTILANNDGDKQRYKFALEANEHKKIILNWKNLVDEDMPSDADGN
jgi:hypothetical protein